MSMTGSSSLPTVRDEIVLYLGPTGANGQPSWVLHDPARNQFFQLDWPTYEILRRWDYGSPTQIVDAVNRETTLEITPEDVESVNEFIDSNYLITRPEVADAIELARRERDNKKAWWLTLMHRYLFFRVPLINPDRWLERWLPLGNFLFSRGFATLTVGVLIFALVKLIQQWDVFQATLLDTFTMKGIITYAFALVGVKVLHELGHGFMAKRYGCRVPVMGVAFLVLFPMAYTDTNDVWKIRDRRKRLEITTAGLRAELLVAAWATFLWVILPDGAIRSAVFFLASVSWIISLFLNISPFMRFDGYFALMDWLKFPNLHARSSALARWQLRRLLFGLNEKQPDIVSKRFKRFLVSFAVLTWIYRFFLFIGIALLVYNAFTKLLGVVLFAVEIYWFILAPVVSELKNWWAKRAQIFSNRRIGITFIIICFAILAIALPLPRAISSQALLRSTKFTEIVVPEPAKLKTMSVTDGTHVEIGTPMIQLESPARLLKRQLAEQRADTATWRYEAASIAQERVGSPFIAGKHSQSALAELQRAKREAGRLSFQAPHNGVFRIENPDTSVGEWLPKDTVIGTLADPTEGLEILTWVDESSVERIEKGAEVRFFPTSHEYMITGHVAEIEEDTTDVLPVPSFASVFGGEILVRQKNGELIPESAIYRVTIHAEQPKFINETRVRYGNLIIKAKSASLVGDYLRSTLLVLIREISP